MAGPNAIYQALIRAEKTLLNAILAPCGSERTMPTQTYRFATLSALLSLSVYGCSTDPDTPDDTTGGPGAGGGFVTGSGGSSAGGGAPATGAAGGQIGSGGTGSGGSPAFGGSGNGGTPAFGGSGNGGTPAFGGSGNGGTPAFGGSGNGGSPVLGGAGSGGLPAGGTGSGGLPNAGGNGSTVECVQGTDTGNDCDPATDTTCSRTTGTNPRDCVCGASGTWTCTPRQDGAGGGPGNGGSPPVGGTGNGGAPSGGGTTDGGAPSGGGTTDGGASPEGGVGNTGGGVTFDCGDIPPAGSGNVPQPSGSAGGLRVLNWAGFKSAVTFSFDDALNSVKNRIPDMTAMGFRVTLYPITQNVDSSWSAVLEGGHEWGNHTRTHNSVSQQDVDNGAADIQSKFGVTPYTFASPNGDEGYMGFLNGKYVIGRDAGGSPTSPNGNANALNVGSYLPSSGASAGEMTGQIDQANSAGQWLFFCIHGFGEGYNPISWENWQAAANHAIDLGEVWIDTADRVGAYYVAQKLITETSGTISWTLPGGFPPNRCLRVTTDGGTITQNGQTVAWDPHGYYEISMDAGSLTLE